MTPAEMTIAALVYVAALLLGQRAIAMGAPEFAEAGFAVGALAGAVTAAVLYFRRTRGRGQIVQVSLGVGAVLAILAVVMGLFTQQLWQTMAAPAITLPIAAAGTLLLPLLIFPILAQLTADRMSGSGGGAGTITGKHVAVAAVAMLVIAGVAFALPVAARSNVKLVETQLPGLTIALPADWPVAEKSELFAYGTVKYLDPAGVNEDKYLAVHWSSGDPVQADEYVKLVTGNELPVRERRVAFPGSHEGVTFYLESDDRAIRAAITIWNCPQDHRVLWVSSFLNGSKGTMLATHQRIIESVHCHTGSSQATTRIVYPNFIAPPGFARDINTPGELLYVGPKGQTIVFDAGVGGQNPLSEAGVSPSVIEPSLKQLVNLKTITDPPTLRSVRDLQGHDRRVWSAAGTTERGEPLQVEMMIWYCDVRKMTFIGGYATRGKHDVQEGIDALLPAVCHR